jgi:hypothetical protein
MLLTRHGYQDNPPEPYLLAPLSGPFMLNRVETLQLGVLTEYAHHEFAELWPTGSRWKYTQRTRAISVPVTMNMRWDVYYRPVEFSGDYKPEQTAQEGLKTIFVEYGDPSWNLTTCEAWYFVEDQGPVRMEQASIYTPLPEPGDDPDVIRQKAHDYCVKFLELLDNKDTWETSDFLDPTPDGIYASKGTIYTNTVTTLPPPGIQREYSDFGFNSPDAMAMVSFHGANASNFFTKLDNPTQIAYINDSQLTVIDSETGSWLWGANLTDAWSDAEAVENEKPATSAGPEAIAYGRNVWNLFGGEMIVFNKGRFWIFNRYRGGDWVTNKGRWGDEEDRGLVEDMAISPPPALYANGGPDAAVSAHWDENAMVFYNEGKAFIFTCDLWSPDQDECIGEDCECIEGDWDVYDLADTYHAVAPPLYGDRQPLDPDAVLMGPFLGTEDEDIGILSDKQLLFTQEGGFWINYPKEADNPSTWEWWGLQSTNMTAGASSTCNGVMGYASSTTGDVTSVKIFDNGLLIGDVPANIYPGDIFYLSHTFSLKPHEVRVFAQDPGTLHYVEVDNSPIEITCP